LSKGKGQFWGEFGASHCNEWGLCDALFSNYFEDLLFCRFEQSATDDDDGSPTGRMMMSRFSDGNSATPRNMTSSKRGRCSLDVFYPRQTGQEKCLQDDWFCVDWDVKPCSFVPCGDSGHCFPYHIAFFQAFISCTVSHVLLWQPSDCVHSMVMIVLCCSRKTNMMMMTQLNSTQLNR